MSDLKNVISDLKKVSIVNEYKDSENNDLIRFELKRTDLLKIEFFSDIKQNQSYFVYKGFALCQDYNDDRFSFNENVRLFFNKANF